MLCRLQIIMSYAFVKLFINGVVTHGRLLRKLKLAPDPTKNNKTVPDYMARARIVSPSEKV